MHCFNSSVQLLQAFSKVTLRKPSLAFGRHKVVSGNQAEPAVRCFNCNSVGHFAADCRKPKRAYGACYSCGSLEHLVSHCNEKNITKNEYVRPFKIYFNSQPNQCLFTECLIDSGSPISFTKLSCVENILSSNIINVNENNFSHYFGLNHIPLDIHGKISCFVIMNKVKFNFELLIVANKSMA